MNTRAVHPVPVLLAGMVVLSLQCAPVLAGRPAGSWPVCDDLRTTFCVRSFSVNGESMLGSDTWRLEAWVLESDNGVESFNWAVEHWNGESWAPAGDPGAIVRFSLNSGDIEALYTDAIASNFSLSRGGTAETGYTMTVDAQPVAIQWKISVEGGNCGAGDCGDDSTQADIDQVTLSGNSQNLNVWTPDEYALFHGLSMATDAQFRMVPIFGSFPEPHWLIQIGNPHLALDGTAARGEYSAQIPPNLLEAMGVTQQAAVDAGVHVTHIAGGVSTELEAAVMATGDGGLYLRIPDFPYSSPQLEFSGAPGLKTVLAPDAPRGISVSALDGGAVVGFRPPFFDGGSRITGYRVICRGDGVVREINASAAVDVEVPGLANGSTLNCRVKARNGTATGRASYAVAVTPLAGNAPLAPGAAPAVHRAVDTAGDLRVSWVEPLSTGGSPILGFVVDICPAGQACPASSVLRKRPGARSIRVASGVVPPGRYVALVRARNAVGLGAGARSRAFEL